MAFMRSSGFHTLCALFKYNKALHRALELALTHSKPQYPSVIHDYIFLHQGIQPADSIHSIMFLTSGLYCTNITRSVSNMWVS